MSDKRVIKAALLGAGVVGSGVYELAQILAEDIEYKTGAALEIKKVLVRNLNKKREGIAEEILTDNWKDIVEDPEIDIVIELMGGIEPARTYILEAIAAGKQVVTANKDLLAEDGRELLEASDAAGTDLLFEASVGGAIPIIRPLKQSMAGDNITEIMGIVNGTTNYILTKMSEKGMSYEDALRQATELGYAESDPTADVEGYDAGRKIAIMASLAFHSRVTFSQVYTEYVPYKNVMEDYTDEELKQIAEKELQKYLHELEKKGVQIISNSVTISLDAGGGHAKGVLTLNGPIGREVPIRSQQMAWNTGEF